MIRIAEMFSGVEGEGKYSGSTTTFIRTQGCQERCRYCDSTDTWDAKGGTEYYCKDVVEYIKLSQVRRVSFTGGNPVLWVDKLLEIMGDCEGHIFNLEHPGKFHDTAVNDLYYLSRLNQICFDIKPPSSGGQSSDRDINLIHYVLTRFAVDTQLKLVFSDVEDLRFYFDIINRYPEFKLRPVYFSPMIRMVIGEPVVSNSSVMYLVERLKSMDCANLRLGIQIHKYLGLK